MTTQHTSSSKDALPTHLARTIVGKEIQLLLVGLVFSVALSMLSWTQMPNASFLSPPSPSICWSQPPLKSGWHVQHQSRPRGVARKGENKGATKKKGNKKTKTV